LRQNWEATKTALRADDNERMMLVELVTPMIMTPGWADGLP